MRKLLGLLLGVTVGAGVGVALVQLFSSANRQQVVSRLQQGWQESLTEARHASQQRRRELEADLAARRRKLQDS